MRIKPNLKRKARNFARQYHSVERVEFVKSLPCAACGGHGRSVNAHVCGPDGASRKGHYTTIAPLCGDPVGFQGQWLRCHSLFDEFRDRFNQYFRSFDPEKAAAECERAWLATHNEEE